jgi:crotonobetainyl-CoA:carnitine CoA-transferase CaiB-like acyl-CoA transferase
MKPLRGVRVIDLTKVLAGPLCTQYLGDMGADVIKVEPPEGDDTRRWPPFYEDPDTEETTGTVFLSVNRNKRSLAINLKSPDGLQIVRKLIATADVLIESNSTGVMERLGLNYESLKKENPRLVYCSISGFGRSGPLKNAKGYDLILQAFCGIMAMTGVPGGPPIRTPLSPIDQATGLNAQSGILAALFAREKTGVGGYLEVSLFDTALALLGFNLQRSWRRGTAPEKSGSGHESLCPYMVYKALDGDVLVGVANDSLWRKFCRAVARPDLEADERFLTNASRVKHYDLTNSIVQEIIATRDIDAWVQIMGEIGVPCVPVNTAMEVLAHPQTAARDMVMQYDHPQFGQLKGVANPVLYADDKRTVDRPPPALGLDSIAVLRELGIEGSEIERLLGAGLVRAHEARKKV